MFDLSTTIVHHDLYRVVPCCLCGAEWEEQWVSVALLIQGKGSLGDLCPRCLSTTPKSRAQHLYELNQRLAELNGQMKEYLTQPLPHLPALGDTATLQAETTRLRERTSQLRLATQQARAARAECWGVTQQTLAQLAKLQRDFTVLMADVSGLESGLLRLDHWPTKLAEVIRLERDYYRQQFSELSELEIRRAVDHRYQHFLAHAA